MNPFAEDAVYTADAGVAEGLVRSCRRISKAAQVFGMALYSGKAVPAGRAGDIRDLVTQNL